VNCEAFELVNAMTWEYIVREFRLQDSTKVSLLEEFLNEAGKDRWELVNVAVAPADPFAHLVYLKRAAGFNSTRFAPDFPTRREPWIERLPEVPN
jgi:hypothetical protein